MTEEHGIYSGVVDIARNGVDEVIRLHAENEALKAELLEQARVNGMGGEREARLMTLNAELVEALHHISLCSQNSMSSQRQCGEIARAALAKVEASK